MTKTLVPAAGLMAALILSAGAATAADLAFVVGNVDYTTGTDLPAEVAPGLDTLEAALKGAGYTLFGGRNLTSQGFFEQLSAFSDQLATADRVVIFYAGNPVTAVRETWATSADFQPVSPVLADFTGPTFDLLLGMAAQARRKSVVIVEAGAEGFEVQSWLKNGVGPVATPDGVLYIEGPAGGLGGFVADTLLAPGATVTSALAAMGTSVTVEGAADADGSLVFGPPAALKPPVYTPPTVTPPAITPPSTPVPAVDPVEAEEASLGLTAADRRHIQEYLAILDFDPRGIDGVFGPRTRGAIAAWQKAEGLRETGYLREGQLKRLENQAQKRANEIAAESERQQREAEKADNAFWKSTGASGKPADLVAYLRRYPEGLHAREAQKELDRLEAAQLAAANAAERRDWEAARRADTVRAYSAYVKAWPKGSFVDAARARSEALQNFNSAAGARERDKAREDALGLSLDSRMSVEQRLKALRLDPGVADGRFDGETRAAIRRYQRTRGLDVTGFLNTGTLGRIVAETR